MASKGRWIEELVLNYRSDIYDLENEIVDTFRPKIEELKDKMIDELKEELESIGFKIYVQWIKKYESFVSLTDFSLKEIFLCKFENNWYIVQFQKGKIYINRKEFRKFATIDMDKVRNSMNKDTLNNLGYVFDEDNNQLILKDKKNCRLSYVYEEYRHRDYSRKYKLDSLLGGKEK